MNIKNLSLAILAILAIISSFIVMGCLESKPKFNASNSGGNVASGVTATPVPLPPPVPGPVAPGPPASGSADPPAPPALPKGGGALTYGDLSIPGSPCLVNGRTKLHAHFMGTALGSDRLLIGPLCIDEGQVWKVIDRGKYGSLNGPSTVISKGDRNFGYVDSSKNIAPDGNPVNRHDTIMDVFGRETISVVAWEDGHEVSYKLYKAEIVFVGDSSDNHVRGICALSSRRGSPSWFTDLRKKCSVGDYHGVMADWKKYATREDLQAETAARIAGDAKKGSSEPPPVGYNPSAP